MAFSLLFDLFSLKYLPAAQRSVSFAAFSGTTRRGRHTHYANEQSLFHANSRTSSLGDGREALRYAAIERFLLKKFFCSDSVGKAEQVLVNGSSKYYGERFL